MYFKGYSCSIHSYLWAIFLYQSGYLYTSVNNFTSMHIYICIYPLSIHIYVSIYQWQEVEKLQVQGEQLHQSLFFLVDLNVSCNITNIYIMQRVTQYKKSIVCNKDGRYLTLRLEKKYVPFFKFHDSHLHLLCKIYSAQPFVKVSANIFVKLLDYAKLRFYN